MNDKTNTAAGAVLASLLATVSAIALTVPAPAMAQTAPAAVTALIRQADYWRGKDRKDLAAQALQRALAAAPRNPDVLAALAKAAAADGDRAASDRWSQQLRAVAPGDPRLATMAAAEKATPPAAALAQARRLAQGGQGAAAAAAYRAIFDGQTPPAAYRLEYYQTLSGVPANWDEGRAGLQKLSSERPDDPAVKLAYAQALTYRETTRREGISRLAALRGGPAPVSQPAQRSWRQALLWLGAGASDRPLYQAYLASAPDDQEVSAKLAQIDTDTRRAAAPAVVAPVDRGAILREQGYAALERRDDATAEARFQEAVKLKANDADALGGLGLIKMRAQAFEEARALLQRAITAAPASRARWQEALGSAQFYADLRAAQTAAQAGDWAKAEALARPLAAGNNTDKRLAQQQLADALARQGRPAEAEAVYRQILAVIPSQPDARNGLVEVLLAQSKFAEAEGLVQGPTERAALSAAQGRIELARANQLWTTGDVGGANTAFETALAARPTDPWTRYDFARFLGEQGQDAAAEGLMAPVAAEGTPEALYVAALFSQRRNRPGDAYAMISQIPANARTADMNTLLGQLRLSAAIADAQAARAAGRSLEALSSLRAIAGQPGLTLGAQSQVASALYDLGDAPQALSLAQQALMQQTKGAPGDYDGFVSVLAKAGRDAEASALIRQVAAQPGAQVQGRQALTDLTITLASERADRLRLAGDLAGAFDTLSATFPTAPNNPRLLGSLARLYQTGGLAEQAGAAYEQLLRLRPGDQDALVGVTQAAIARKDWPRARQSLAQAMSRAPNDANLYLLAAGIEEGAGDRKAALRALATAKSLRQRQFAFNPGVMGGAPTPGAGPLGPNPFGGGGGGASYMPQSYQPPATVAFMPTPAALPSGYDGGRFQSAAWTPPLSAMTPAMPSPSTTQPWRTVAPPSPAQPQPTAPTADRSYLYGQAYPATPAYPGVPAYPVPSAYPAAPSYPVAAAYPAAPAYPAYPAPATAPRGNPFGPAAAADPLTESIDDRIASLTVGVKPTVEARVEYRGRSGEAGLSQLSDITANISASVSPFSTGKLMVSLQPVTLDAGTASADSLLKIGFNPIARALSLFSKVDPVYATPGAQTASGVGTDVSFTLGSLVLDAGTTPIGFTNIMGVGGLSWSPRLGRNAVAKLWVERRAVTDSLTSYAGSEEPATGLHWGQVLRTTKGASFSYDTGASGFYADGQLNDYQGSNVADNSSYQFNLGAYFRPYQKGDTELQIGLNLNRQHYDNNQNFFSFGQGGYFSPQAFTSLSLPVGFKTRRGLWDIEVQGVPGYQTYEQNGAPYYPNDPGAQGILLSLAKLDSRVATGFADAKASGFGILGTGRVEYRFSPGVRLGGSASFNNFGAYSETKVALYARQTLGAGVR